MNLKMEIWIKFRTRFKAQDDKYQVIPMKVIRKKLF